MSRFLAICTVALMFAFSASAQEMSVFGTWQKTSMGPPRSVATIVYTPNGEMFSELAVAPQPGQGGGGVLRTMARYQLQGPTTLVITYGPSEMCAAGSPCGPAPPQMVPYPGSQNVINITFRGSDQIVDGDGSVWLRIR